MSRWHVTRSTHRPPRSRVHSGRPTSRSALLSHIAQSHYASHLAWRWTTLRGPSRFQKLQSKSTTVRTSYHAGLANVVCLSSLLPTHQCMWFPAAHVHLTCYSEVPVQRLLPAPVQGDASRRSRGNSHPLWSKHAHWNVRPRPDDFTSWKETNLLTHFVCTSLHQVCRVCELHLPKHILWCQYPGSLTRIYFHFHFASPHTFRRWITKERGKKKNTRKIQLGVLLKTKLKLSGDVPTRGEPAEDAVCVFQRDGKCERQGEREPECVYLEKWVLRVHTWLSNILAPWLRHVCLYWTFHGGGIWIWFWVCARSSVLFQQSRCTRLTADREFHTADLCHLEDLIQSRHSRYYCCQIMEQSKWRNQAKGQIPFFFSS